MEKQLKILFLNGCMGVGGYFLSMEKGLWYNDPPRFIMLNDVMADLDLDGKTVNRFPKVIWQFEDMIWLLIMKIFKIHRLEFKSTNKIQFCWCTYFIDWVPRLCTSYQVQKGVNYYAYLFRMAEYFWLLLSISNEVCYQYAIILCT